ncbi:hypothetical protein B0T10DRAFT_325171 [Thelonectria olida]|uniref:Hydrophobin 1 n=1 Tax=Thelonectria olida TaxID=1576542 RepID=A0A9P8VPI4_9HYPO|nr:hypothetical protein B0T10DRAFT_325171 [Thelonectria olida]
MQVTSIIALAIAATGALASPGRAPPEKPSRPVGKQSASIVCSTGAPYCCTSEISGGLGYFECSRLTDVCNSIAVCCNNQAQQGASASQTCAAFGNAKVVYI